MSAIDYREMNRRQSFVLLDREPAHYMAATAAPLIERTNACKRLQKCDPDGEEAEQLRWIIDYCNKTILKILGIHYFEKDT